MDYTITSPETKQIPVTTTVEQQFPLLKLTTVVWGMNVDTGDRSLSIGWVEGYMDGGAYVRGQEYEATFSESELAAKFGETPTESTVWADDEKRWWALLSEHEPPYIPAGTTS